MIITLNDTGKKFEREWIFKSLSFTLKAGDRIVVKGGNGSGKSTILQILLGKSIPTKGSIEYKLNDTVIEPQKVFYQTCIASPFLELIEEFNLEETIDTHFGLRKLHPEITKEEIPSLLYLEKDQAKPLELFSSGMKQRVKLALAILTDAPILLLDEPCSNLDQKGIDWYHGMIEKFGKDRIIVVASNENKEEYPFCNQELNIEDFK